MNHFCILLLSAFVSYVLAFSHQVCIMVLKSFLMKCAQIPHGQKIKKHHLGYGALINHRPGASPICLHHKFLPSCNLAVITQNSWAEVLMYSCVNAQTVWTCLNPPLMKMAWSHCEESELQILLFFSLNFLFVFALLVSLISANTCTTCIYSP